MGREVWGIGWQVSQFGAGPFNGFADSHDLVTGEIIHHHDVTRFQLWHQMLLDPTPKQRAANRTVDR